MVVGAAGATCEGTGRVGRGGAEDTIGLNAPINGCTLGITLGALASRALTAFACETLADAEMVMLGCKGEIDVGSGTGFNDSFGSPFSDWAGGCVTEAWFFCRGICWGTNIWG